MKSALLATAALSVIATSAFGQGVDPLIGTWKINPGELNVQPSTSQKSVANFRRRGGQNRTLTADGVDANSQLFKVVYRHIYDGQPHPTTGSPDYDSSTYTRTGNTINGVRFKEGKPVEVLQNVIVPNKTLTITAEGIAANGQPYHYVLVCDRQ